jgi:hypothetical protein
MVTDTAARANQRRAMPRVVILGPAATLTEITEPALQQAAAGPFPCPTGPLKVGPCFDRFARWPTSAWPPSVGTLGGGARSILLEVEPVTKREDLALKDFAERLAAIPEVVAMSHATEGTIQRVWTFVVRRDKALRRRVYLDELGLMEAFPDLQFDFNVVTLEDAPARGLVPDDLQGHIVCYRGNRVSGVAAANA